MRSSAALLLSLLPGAAAASQGPGVGQGAAGAWLQAAAACLALGPLVATGLLASWRILRRDPSPSA